MSSTHLLVLLTVVLAAVVVAVLAVALIEVRRGLRRISEGLATLSAALQTVEAEHLRPLEGAVKAINGQFDIILGALTLWWIGNVVLLAVVLPVVVYLLHGVLSAAKAIVPSVQEIGAAAAAGSKDLDAAALLLTTQEQVTQTVAVAANYGGSLDVILDDAQ
jgi:hypothetical protein